MRKQLTRDEINELAVYYARLGSKARLAECTLRIPSGAERRISLTEHKEF